MKHMVTRDWKGPEIRGSIRVIDNAPEVKGKKIIGTPKTEGSVRTVPTSSKLRNELKAHFDGLYTVGWFNPENIVFPFSQSNFRSRVFQPAAERAKVFDKDGRVPTVHDLRHTAISLWLQRGLTPFEVSKMVGHTDLKMIEKRYGHLYESELQKKIDRIGGEV